VTYTSGISRFKHSYDSSSVRWGLENW